MKIVAEQYIPHVEHYFGHYGELILKPGREITVSDVKDADILLVRAVTQVNENLLANSRVKYVGSVTAGADHLDTHWLDQAGIAWDVAAGFNAPPVADYVVSVIAALQRKKIVTQNKLKAAVIGVGHVGKLVTQHLQLLDMNVVTCDPIRAATEEKFSSVALENISDCDIITLHVPLTKSGEHPTYHFIDREFLSRQKPGCVLINASRGAVLDEQILLLHGTHLHWCLDVFEHEPTINQHILERALLATPHIAGYSVQGKIRGIDMIYRAACAKKIIEPMVDSPINMPRQTLRFAGENHHWQDMVLGVFNPIIMTSIMRTTLLSEEIHGPLFDKMRHEFSYRHELAYTSVSGVVLPDADIRILAKLGMQIL
ncbi:MAG: hypothetical protein ACD_46C00710G0002 [uncultured bacterium]|nr:MAG: hypothetical protein ACD_46C00710G0002 [uncultured bacterium]